MHSIRSYSFFIRRSIICAASLFLTTSLSAADRPDIVFVLLDDLGFSDISPYGGEITTPTLDRLAAEGLRFTDFYNASKCEPTRASVMSGLYWPVTQLNLIKGMTIGEVLQDSGYATFAIGKWHLAGNPVDRGFDRYFGHLSGASSFFPPVSNTFRLDKEPYRPTDPDWYSTDAMTDHALEFIEESHSLAPEKPFFLYLAYNAPHNPLQAPKEDIMRYRGQYLKGWEALRAERYARQIEIGLWDSASTSLSPRPLNIPAWDSLTPEQQNLEDLRMAVYAAMVDRVDQNLSRLLSRLETLGRADNLLVVFLSDNGASPYWRTDAAMLAKDRLPGDPQSNWEIGLGWANASNTPFRLYKRNQHEGGILTPMIAWWSKGVAQPGGFVREPSHIIDLMPTFIELAGAEYPEKFAGKPNPPLPGKSLMPLLRGAPREPHEALYFLLFDHAAIRKGDWKLSRVDGKDWELFNLAEDRSETQNRAAQNPEMVNAIEAKFSEWMKAVGMLNYNNPTPASDLRDDRGGGLPYQPSSMPIRLKGRYPLPALATDSL